MSVIALLSGEMLALVLFSFCIQLSIDFNTVKNSTRYIDSIKYFNTFMKFNYFFAFNLIKEKEIQYIGATQCVFGYCPPVILNLM